MSLPVVSDNNRATLTQPAQPKGPPGPGSRAVHSEMGHLHGDPLSAATWNRELRARIEVNWRAPQQEILIQFT